MLRALATIIAIATGAIAIYQFVTGKVSLNTVSEQAVSTFASASPRVKGQAITHVDLSRFTPITRRRGGADQLDRIFAIEPGQWFNSAWIVELDCQLDEDCSGRRLMPIRSPLNYVDTITLTPDASKLVALNRDGAGAIYSFATRRVTDFSFTIPCQRTSYEGPATPNDFGTYTLHDVRLEGRQLSMRAHGQNCDGIARIGGHAFPVTQRAGVFASGTAYSEFLIQIGFDAAGLIADASLSTNRFEKRQPPGPTWFRNRSSNAEAPVAAVASMLLPNVDAVLAALHPYAGPHIFVSPDIPPDIRNGALSAGVKGEELLAVFDMTLFANGTVGVYFLPDRLVTNSGTNSLPISIPYSALRGVEPRREFTAILYGDRRIVSLDGPQFARRESLIAAIRDVASQTEVTLSATAVP